MNKKMMTPEQVKSCVNSLETSPSKNASQSNPTYSKMSGNKGGKGGFSTKKK